MVVKMGFPSIDTVNLFYEILKREGMDRISESVLLKSKDLRLIPSLSYLKTVLLNLIADDLIDEANGYSAGFITCLDMFRRQLSSEEISLEDVEIQLKNVCAWTSYLEEENMRLKDQIKELEMK